TEPYGGIREPLRRALGAEPDAGDDEVAKRLSGLVERVLPDRLPLLPLLGAPFGLRLPETEAAAELSADHRREELLTGTVRLLLELLPSACVLVVEDPSWLDDGSEQLLSGLLRVLPGWAMLVTHWPGSRKLDL